MRKHKRRYKLNVIVPTLLVMPPLGFYLLWVSPRTLRVKVVVSAMLILVFATAGTGVVKNGYYKSFFEPPIPASGFDVSRDNRGGYRIDRVLPLERQIFNEVVREMRRLQKQEGLTYVQREASQMVDPETRAIANVAEQHGLDLIDAQLIFMKVSSKMAQER